MYDLIINIKIIAYYFLGHSDLFPMGKLCHAMVTFSFNKVALKSSFTSFTLFPLSLLTLVCNYYGLHSLKKKKSLFLFLEKIKKFNVEVSGEFYLH